MARDYNAIIISHFEKLPEAIDKRQIADKDSLLMAILNDWEFEKAFTLTVACIGELSGKLDSIFKTTHDCIDWAALKSIRNIINHDYEAVNFRRVINIYYNAAVPLIGVIKQPINNTSQVEVIRETNHSEDRLKTDKQSQSNPIALDF